MKLNELKGIKEYADKDSEAILSQLFDAGVFKKELGRGGFGIAFELKNGEVLKVWAEDQAYEKYITYCSANQSNPFLVRTLGKVKKFKMKYEEYDEDEVQEMKFIRIEKLDEADNLTDFGYPQPDRKKSQSFLYDIASVVLEEFEDVPEPGTDEFLTWAGLDPKKATPKFKKFIEVAIEVFRHLRNDLGLELDLKMNNFAKRGDQIVFLDPVIDEFFDVEPIEIEKVLAQANKKKE